MMDLIFDLDGTLIDSASGVLTSLVHALEVCGQVPQVPLDRALIGPPLRQTLSILSGTMEPHLLDHLVFEFKRHYDSEGFLRTYCFADTTEYLQRWAGERYRMFIATNKRLTPTRAILHHLGLDTFFSGIHTVDETSPPVSSKVELVRRIIALHELAPGGPLLIGDTMDDGVAAQVNGLRFVFAAYGYGKAIDPTIPCLARIGSLSDLDPILTRMP